MRKLVVTENITLDGVIELNGDWFNPGGGGDDLLATMREQDATCDAVLLGRQTYEDFRGYQSRGETYYGRDYGTQGQATRERYSGSSYAQSGGFRDSKYASKPGGYRDSKYATPGNTAPKQFGRRPDALNLLPTHQYDPVVF